ncbi:PIG-L deacetylase family protein [Fluviicola taffensis]|uniref:LmbE family protein n=1 Tax=Fluviicola taffensis (strain DSM 16823 / NCIMB 13979 / RW262) TaxID=755732 RepID=F2IA18_FLUTR|nr:PIG-L deacetylase family protein [Fluviicola taffensis]AEA44176.1 LmbE family protein [Fluviicola taffensis DSM 16823]
MKDKKRVLVLAPHTDDGEFGCGGTIAKFIEEGHEVTYAAFSACQQSVLPQFPSDILITEVKAATKVLGIKPDNLLLFDYDVRTFGYHRQEILDDLIKIRADFKPDLILMPDLQDVHQDHATVATEGLRAFKFSSILSYELPWNNLSFTTSSFVHLDERHVQTKVNALKEYQSQAHRPYSDEDFLRSVARTRGVQIGTKYAEAFNIVRWIID